MTPESRMELISTNPLACAIASIVIVAVWNFLENLVWSTNGSWYPRCISKIEHNIISHPMQARSRDDSFCDMCDVVFDSKPLRGLQSDASLQLNTQNGDMLGVCDEYGIGKSATVCGLALSHYEGMPTRVYAFLRYLDKSN